LHIHTVADVGQNCRPGDTVRPDRYHCSDGTWRTLRRLLAQRGLQVAGVGQRYFVFPADASPQLPFLRGLAAGDGLAEVRALGRDVTLTKLLTQLCGGKYPRGLAAALRDACATANGRHVTVPGGEPTTPGPSQADKVREAGRKLSKLQRGLLTWVKEMVNDYGRTDVPMGLVPPHLRTSAPALSRAWRRLAARGLVAFEQSRGQEKRVRLTDEGNILAPQTRPKADPFG
jgi:hypothetical protein